MYFNGNLTNFIKPLRLKFRKRRSSAAKGISIEQYSVCQKKLQARELDLKIIYKRQFA